MKCESIQGAV